MKSYVVHLMNKYFGARVTTSGSTISVHSANGQLLCSLARDAHGGWSCSGFHLGAKHRFDLAPIPKDCRAYKLYKDGRVGESEEFQERSKISKAWCDQIGYVPSVKDIDDSKLVLEEFKKKSYHE